MRESLTTSFDSIAIADLHGSAKKKEATPDGSIDENVFDIMAGVGVGIFIKALASSRPCRVRHTDCFGTRENKLRWIQSVSFSSVKWTRVTPLAPFYVFVPQDEDLTSEYQCFWSLIDIMPVRVLGFQTHRDKFAIDFDRERLKSRICEMLDRQVTDSELSAKYGLCDNRDWQLSRARRELRGLKKNWDGPLMDCLYRPFDLRTCYFSTIAMDYPRRELLDHVAGRANKCLLVSRQTSTVGWRHVFVSAPIAESCAVSLNSREGNYNIPLYLFEKRLMSEEETRRANVSESFTKSLSFSLGLNWTGPDGPHGNDDFSAEDLLSYIYAILHSPTYRTRYAKSLRMDFPRIPLIRNSGLFRSLVAFGRELLSEHLMTSQKPKDRSATFIGGDSRHVEKVSYSDSTVWIDRSETRGFRRVPKDVWNFHIGGYQVCEKWLKDRQARGGKNPRPGRILTAEDIDHYQKIVVALSETIRIMAEIDKVIDAHGGWPGAFKK
jgi:predicted helicase